MAPTTVRTWDRRYGLGPTAHTGGRHRRWTDADVARLERMCALTATGLPPAEAARLALDEVMPDAPAPRAGTAPLRRRPPADAAGPAPACGWATCVRSAEGSRARPCAWTPPPSTNC